LRSAAEEPGTQLELVDELFAPDFAPTACEWFGAFRSSFPDLHMEIVETVTKGDRVVARFKCSPTHLGLHPMHRPFGLGAARKHQPAEGFGRLRAPLVPQAGFP
jgi:hypothetical protein